MLALELLHVGKGDYLGRVEAAAIAHCSPTRGPPKICSCRGPSSRSRADGRRAPETVLIAASPQLRAYVAHLGDRAERVRCGSVSPEQDNMLLISTDGRKAALDMRLVGGGPAPGSSKLDVAAERITQVWREHSDRTYRDPGGQTSATPGRCRSSSATFHPHRP